MRTSALDGMVSFMAYRIVKLTAREAEAMQLVSDGLTNAEIAACLHISRETVKSELKRIFRKIGVGNRTQAAVLLVKNSWI